MSAHTNPKLAAIDDALTEVEPILEEFGLAHGFTLTRSHEHSYNVPYRKLHRESGVIRHEIGLIISSDMPERLERGFFPDIPCTMYIAAHDRQTHMRYGTRIFEAVPFSALRSSLQGYLMEAERKLATCTLGFIAEHGTRDPLA
jgi:hypothetical protein